MDLNEGEFVLRWAKLIRLARRMMLVVGRRRDETIGAAGSGVNNTAVAVGSGVIPMAGGIETRG